MNYESSNTCFPLQSQNASATKGNNGGAPSWITGVLQFTEAVPQFNALNFNVNLISSNFYGGWANSTVAFLNIAILTCPSESRNQGQYPFLAIPGQYYGMSNYVGNYGGPGVISLMSGTIIPANNYMVGSATNPADGTAGLNLYPGATWGPIRIASITDGTSNTGLISEKLVGIPSPYPQTVAAAGQDLPRCAIRSTVTAAVGSGATGALNFVQACATVPGTKGIRFCGNTEQWLSGFPSWLVWQSYNHFGTPNQVNCTNPADPKDPAGSNPVGVLRHSAGERAAQQPPPGRRQRRLRRRLGPFHQDLHRAEYVVGPRQPQRRRGRQLRCVLRRRRSPGRADPDGRASHPAGLRPYIRQRGYLMKRLFSGLVVILFSIQAIGCDSGTTDSAAPAAGSPAPGDPTKDAGGAAKGVAGPVNPNGPKNDR